MPLLVFRMPWPENKPAINGIDRSRKEEYENEVKVKPYSRPIRPTGRTANPLIYHKLSKIPLGPFLTPYMCIKDRMFWINGSFRNFAFIARQSLRVWYQLLILISVGRNAKLSLLSVFYQKFYCTLVGNHGWELTLGRCYGDKFPEL